MAMMETLFDVAYLCLVIGLGFRLLLELGQGAKLFGWMAILLGAGDAFHLLPRIISHLSPLGFAGHSWALSFNESLSNNHSPET